MKVSREMFRMVRWLLVGALVLQLIVVPWQWYYQGDQSGYAPIFAPPHGANTTIVAGRLLLQLAVTGGLLLLWLRVAKPEE